MFVTRLVLAACVLAALLSASPASGAVLTFTAISTPFNSPIGIDYHEPSNTVVVSVNYASGSPHALERINADGTHTQFSALAGVTDEVKIATVRSGNVGGFVTGDLFVGNGTDGQIVRITNNGSTVINPFVDLPGASNGLMRGSLFVDRTGAFGGDLIAVTTNGEVWRVNAAGTPTFIADVNTHLEGVMVVPNDVAKYGPLAGKIIAGAEDQGRMYVIDANGTVTFYTLGVNIEDIDMISANENFFGVNYGTGRILGVEAAQFASFVGDILLTQEFGGSSGLYRLYWNGSQLVAEEFTVGAGSAPVGQWEHVTFAPAGIREIGATVPEPATLVSWTLLAATFGIWRVRMRKSKMG